MGAVYPLRPAAIPENSRIDRERLGLARWGYHIAMTRVVIAVDGSELDEHVARTAFALFGESCNYWVLNVQEAVDPTPRFAALHPVPVAFGGAYPYVSPDLYMDQGDVIEGSDPGDRTHCAGRGRFCGCAGRQGARWCG
jgi:hypothetical protein